MIFFSFTFLMFYAKKKKKKSMVWTMEKHVLGIGNEALGIKSSAPFHRI